MDQRVDADHFEGGHRAEADGGKEVSADARPRKTRSWRDTFREHRLLLLGLTVVLIIVTIGIVLWWLDARRYVSSDDAFIDARTVQIGAQVAAAIVDVPVTDNQPVKAGTVLIRLDDRDYKAQLDQAKAQVQQSQANIADLNAQLAAQEARIEQADNQVTQAKAALSFADQQAARYQQLAKQGSATQEQAQQYSSNDLQSQATFAAAQANAVAVRKQNAVIDAQIGLAKAQLAQAQATQEDAEANLSRTAITAPVDGRVTRLTAAKGAWAAVGGALLMFVPNNVWVTANFKETELALMRPGDPVTLEIDAFPGRKFEGHVDSIQAGSGTAFSLLPAENATGNYVKIVQRVPVKIVFNQPPDVLLGPGMSVVPTVKVR